MAGLDPAIHVSNAQDCEMDGRLALRCARWPAM